MHPTDRTLFARSTALEYKALCFIVLAAFLMAADQRFGYMERVQFLTGYLTAPIHWLTDVPARISLWGGGALMSHAELLSENDRLRQELLVAQHERQLLEGVISENSRLLQLREATSGIDGEVLPAEIINVSPDPYSERVLINKGRRDGVSLGQPLLDANGLMGQVDQVLPMSSWVLLLTDPTHVTPVEVNRNGERALARGSRNTAGELQLEFVTHSQDMAPGDLLVSSGMGQVYPKNYPVGEIIAVERDPGQPFAQITARPRASLDSTRHVMLLFLPPPPAEPVAVPEATPVAEALVSEPDVAAGQIAADATETEPTADSEPETAGGDATTDAPPLAASDDTAASPASPEQ